MFDYLSSFPISKEFLPERLKQLLSPVGLESPTAMIEVAARYDQDTYGPDREYYHYMMVTVPEAEQLKIEDYYCSSDGFAEYPAECNEKGGLADGHHHTLHNHIVASWGNGSFFSFYLSQDVWMSMGLTPRCVGGDAQRVIFDDLSVPTVGVAEGDLSCSYYFTPDKNVHWTMRNDYLRRYLWERGDFGIRVFYYEGYVTNPEPYEVLLSKDDFYSVSPEHGWYDLKIIKNDKGILLQLHGVVAAIEPVRCEQRDIYSLIWPGDSGPLTKAMVDAFPSHNIFLDDSFLEKYEKNSVYKSTPYKYNDHFGCSPSYLGQWSFTECARIGRNLIKVPVRELYKPKPDGEILHAYDHAISEEEAQRFDFSQEHIVSKTFRFVEQILCLGENIHQLAQAIGAQDFTAEECTGFSREKINYSGWTEYPIILKLAQVAPIAMKEQDFLSRCKTLSEVLARIKSGPLKKILEVAGCPDEKISKIGSLKRLQALGNLVTKLTDDLEPVDSFPQCADGVDWEQRNEAFAPLFIIYDLRNADAHENIRKCIEALESIGFDHASLRDGYGLCFDYVFDQVIDALNGLNNKVFTLQNT